MARRREGPLAFRNGSALAPERTCVLYDGGMEWLHTSQPARLSLSTLSAQRGRGTGARAGAGRTHHVGLHGMAGVAASVEAVGKWRRAHRECERDAAYWIERADDDVASPRVLRKAARAMRRLERHIAAGSTRLYRSRKHIERSGGLIVLDGAPACRAERSCCRAHAARPRCASRFPFSPPDGWEWTGAVQIVDITDRKGRVTRRARPAHRTYMARAILRAPAPHLAGPERIDEVMGVDVGVAVTAYGSDGSQHHMPDESAKTAVIKDAERRREPVPQRAPPHHGGDRHDARHACRGQRGPAPAHLLRASAPASSRGVCRVSARGTSLTCRGCGAPGIREAQADFYCPECGLRSNADLNICGRAYPRLVAARRQGMSP